MSAVACKCASVTGSVHDALEETCITDVTVATAGVAEVGVGFWVGARVGTSVGAAVVVSSVNAVKLRALAALPALSVNVIVQV